MAFHPSQRFSEELSTGLGQKLFFFKKIITSPKMTSCLNTWLRISLISFCRKKIFHISTIDKDKWNYSISSNFVDYFMTKSSKISIFYKWFQVNFPFPWTFVRYFHFINYKGICTRCVAPWCFECLCHTGNTTSKYDVSAKQNIPRWLITENETVICSHMRCVTCQIIIISQYLDLPCV